MLFGYIDGNEHIGIVQCIQQQPGFHQGAAAVFDQRGAGADQIRNFLTVGLDQRRFRPRQVIFLEPANSYEQLRAPFVIKVFARQLFLLPAQSADNIGQERPDVLSGDSGGTRCIHLQASSAMVIWGCPRIINLHKKDWPDQGWVWAWLIIF